MNSIQHLEKEANVKVRFESGALNKKAIAILSIAGVIATIALVGAILSFYSPSNTPFLQNLNEKWAWSFVAVGGSSLLIASLFSLFVYKKHTDYVKRMSKAMFSNADEISTLIEGCKTGFDKLRIWNPTCKASDEPKSLGRWGSYTNMGIYLYLDDDQQILTFIKPGLKESFEKWLNQERTWTQL